MGFARIGRVMLAAVVSGAILSPATGFAAAKPHAKSASNTAHHDGKAVRHVRILVPYSKTYFFVDRGRQLGASAEIGMALQRWLNQNDAAHGRAVIDFVTVARDKLVPALLDGKGDVIAADIALGKDQEGKVALTNPWIADIKEVVVLGPASPKIGAVEDLSGKEVYVRHSSTYADNLFAFNKDLAAMHVTPISLRPADGSLEDEDLLEMVNAGLLPAVVVDENVAKFWGAILPRLTIRSDLVMHSGGDIDWVVRKDDPHLLAELNAFLKTRRNVAGDDVKFVQKHYYSSAQIVSNVYDDAPIERFERLLPSFRRYADQFRLDALLLAAQGYQESQLKQTPHGAHGTMGVMQLLPATAANKVVGIKGVYTSADRNIEAGAKYMRYLIDTYLDDPKIDPTNRMLMALAAYNAGPEKLNRFREAAARDGFDPHLWFGNVENGAARVAGRGTVQYVSNIYKYYIAYKLRNERTDTESVAVQPAAQP